MTNFSWSLDAPLSTVVRLELVGDMTLGAREAMREAFESVVEAKTLFAVIDFSQVRLVSSGAIGELVRCHSRLTAKGCKTRLICPAGDVLETLMVADMHRLIPLISDMDQID
jgi:anti-anti-sigma factor